MCLDPVPRNVDAARERAAVKQDRFLRQPGDPGARLIVRWLPEHTAESLDAAWRELGAATVGGYLGDRLPDRLSRALCAQAGVDPTAELLGVYREAYAGEPFVRVLDEGERPTTRGVVGSNYCDVTVVADARTGRAVCLSALDNLGKGGSANGVQNLNILSGWPERAGLEAPPVYP